MNVYFTLLKASNLMLINVGQRTIQEKIAKYVIESLIDYNFEVNYTR